MYWKGNAQTASDFDDESSQVQTSSETEFYTIVCHSKECELLYIFRADDRFINFEEEFQGALNNRISLLIVKA